MAFPWVRSSRSEPRPLFEDYASRAASTMWQNFVGYRTAPIAKRFGNDVLVLDEAVVAGPPEADFDGGLYLFHHVEHLAIGHDVVGHAVKNERRPHLADRLAPLADSALVKELTGNLKRLMVKLAAADQEFVGRRLQGPSRRLRPRFPPASRRRSAGQRPKDESGRPIQTYNVDSG
jgi:hypothetical protein